MSQFSSQSTRIAIVTGGSRGIGRSTVEHLARRGTRVIFTNHTRREEADSVVTAAKKLGSEAYALQLNTGKVADFDAFAEGVRSVLAQLGAESCFDDS
jgi:NAD(P)-dependent dehydrogenase (short-subunit alcohol dehydrogenase family)